MGSRRGNGHGVRLVEFDSIAAIVLGAVERGICPRQHRIELDRRDSGRNADAHGRTHLMPGDDDAGLLESRAQTLGNESRLPPRCLE